MRVKALFRHRSTLTGVAVLAIWLLVLLIVSRLVIEDSRYVELISGKAGGEAVVLEAGQTLEQRFYAHADFQGLRVRKANAAESGIIAVSFFSDTSEDPAAVMESVSESGDDVFAAEKTEGLFPAGNWRIVIENRTSAQEITFLYTDGMYDDAFLDHGNQTKLSMSVYRYSDAPRVTFFLSGLLFAAGVLFLFFTREAWRQSPERFALPTVLTMGIIFILLVPAWCINDFPSHFGLAWHRTNLLLGTAGREDYVLTLREDDIPVYAYVMQDKNVSYYNPSKRCYMDTADGLFSSCQNDSPVLTDIPGPRALGMSFYSAWNYAPFIAAFVICRWFGAGLLFTVTCGRIVALCLYALLIFRAVRRMTLQFGKWAMALFALIPVNIMNLTAVTYDGLVLAVVYNLIAMVFHLGRNREEILRPVRVAEMICWCFLLGAAKAGGYAVFVFLVFSLLSRPFKERKNLIVPLCLAVTLLTVLYFDVWAQAGQPAFFQFQENEGYYSASYVLHHPWKYFTLWLSTFLLRTGDYFHSAMGDLGWSEAVFPWYISCTMMISMLYTIRRMAASGEVTAEPCAGKKERCLLLVIILIVVISVPVTVIYGNPLDAKVLWGGVQGRYFLPVLLPLVLLFQKRFATTDGKEISRYGGLLGVMINYMAVLHFMMRTYMMR